MLWHKLNVLTCLCCQWMMDCIKKTVKLKKSRKIYLLFTFRMYLNVFIYFWPKYMFPAIEFPSVERGCLYIFWPCRLQSYQMSIKRWSSLGSIRRLSAGYLERGPGFYFLGSWVCDVMATMTGCWAGVTWCWADSVKPSSSILGRLVWGSPGCSAKVSALGCLLTSTGGELEAWAAKIWRGLLRPDALARLVAVATAPVVCLPFWVTGRTGSWCKPGVKFLPSPPCTALSTVWITRSLFSWASLSSLLPSAPPTEGALYPFGGLEVRGPLVTTRTMVTEDWGGFWSTWMGWIWPPPGTKARAFPGPEDMTVGWGGAAMMTCWALTGDPGALWEYLYSGTDASLLASCSWWSWEIGEPSLLRHSGVCSPLDGGESSPWWVGDAGALLEERGPNGVLKHATPLCRLFLKACSTSLLSEAESTRQKLPFPGSSWERATFRK